MNNLSHAELTESFSLAGRHNTDTEKLLAFLDAHFALSEGLTETSLSTVFTSAACLLISTRANAWA